MSRGDNLACFQVPANHRWGKKVNTTMAAVSLPVCYFHGAARDAHATYRDVLTPLDMTLTDYEPPARHWHQPDASACEPASEPDRLDPVAEQEDSCIFLLFWGVWAMLSGSASVAGLMDTPVKDDDQAPDDQSMHFLCSPTAMIQENTPSETVVYTAEAVDPDGLPVRYALDAVSTPDNVYFTLDAENGDLRFRASPDYETPNGGGADGNEYWVSIIATQGITDVRQRVVVSVTDVNEPPVFVSEELDIVVPGEKAAAFLHTVEAIDAEGERVTYRLTEGAANDNHLFAIDDHGRLTLKSPPSDSADIHRYRVDITASDGVTDVVQPGRVTILPPMHMEIRGAAKGDQSGWSVSGPGDYNQDGYNDLLIGARLAGAYQGKSYVLFGGPQRFTPDTSMPLPSIDFRGVSDGVIVSNHTGDTVRYAGDVNGDGRIDVIVGNPKSYKSLGVSVVVLGHDLNFQEYPPKGLSIYIYGEDDGEASGLSVDAAGDFNGDGIDDVLIAARKEGGSEDGAAYVVFGHETNFKGSIALSRLTQEVGFVFAGIKLGPDPGRYVSRAGDINGDGVDDILIGSAWAHTVFGSFTGQAFVVFGSSDPLPSRLTPSELNGQNGFSIDGDVDNGRFGYAVSVAGDINNDGIDDLIIGAPEIGGHDQFGRGMAYVIFGQTDGFGASLDLALLDGRNGFAMTTTSESAAFGWSVSTAGDVNGDAIADIVVGAPAGNDGGQSYVIFGRDTAFEAVMDMSSLNGENGFMISSQQASQLGHAVSAAGDINDDGIGDLVVSDPDAAEGAGITHVIFGRTDFVAHIDLPDVVM